MMRHGLCMSTRSIDPCELALQEVFDEIAGLRPAATFAPHLRRVAEAAAPGPGFLQFFVSIATRPSSAPAIQARHLSHAFQQKLDS